MNFIKTSFSTLERFCATIAIVAIVIGLVPFAVHVAEAGIILTGQDNVTICHAAGASGNYTRPAVNVDSIITLPNGHNDHADDIIPPFEYNLGDGDQSYPGKNWDTEGQALWNNDCVPVEPEPVLGCTDEEAQNYDSEATEDDGSCIFDQEPILGCTDIEALNFDPLAEEDDGSCIYSEDPILGCTDVEAVNFNPEATEDDGSCEYGEPQGDEMTIVAYKIECTDENDLPNWGSGGSNITSATAEDWVTEHDSCEFKEGWEFEWGPEDAGDPGDTHIGPAGGDWTTFGPTNVSGMTSTSLTADDIGDNDHLWFREVLQENYIPFTHDQNGNSNEDNVTAEVYCHIDVRNYDNYDRIDGVDVDETFYCVAWNVIEEDDEGGTITGKKWNWNDETGIVGWGITLIDAVGNEEQTNTDDEGLYWFNDLLPGVYTVCEDLPELWKQKQPTEGVACENGTVGHEITIEEDEIIRGIDFWNQHDPVIIIDKVTSPYSSEQEFEFDISWSDTHIELSDTDEPWNSGDLADILDAENPFSIAEVNLPEGWDLSSAVCESNLGDDESASSIDLNPGEIVTCTFTNIGEDLPGDTYLVDGYVWNDENENDIWDGFDSEVEQGDIEESLSGWEVTITNGDITFSTTTDGNGYYFFNVPAGTWTITETIMNEWSQTFPNDGTHVVTVPEVVTEGEGVSIFASAKQFFIPVVYAQTPTVSGPHNFGNVFVGCTSNCGGGGGGGGKKIELSSGGGSSSDADDPEPEPEVLGEQVSVIPVGAPNTGAGGAAGVPLTGAVAFFGMLLSMGALRWSRNG